MKKIILMLKILTLSLFFTGCVQSTHQIGESGYEELNHLEKQYLVALARKFIGDDPQVRNNREQWAFVQQTEPDIRISYRSNLYGRAIITWVYKKKTMRVVFAGLLNSTSSKELTVRYSVINETDQITLESDGSLAKPTLDITRTERQLLIQQ